MGGGNISVNDVDNQAVGLSPRGRGKLLDLYSNPHASRSIPAWAGETRSSHSTPKTHQVYPRVGGGNELQIETIAVSAGLSPRGRGKQA